MRTWERDEEPRDVSRARRRLTQLWDDVRRRRRRRVILVTNAHGEHPYLAGLARRKLNEWDRRERSTYG